MIYPFDGGVHGHADVAIALRRDLHPGRVHDGGRDRSSRVGHLAGRSGCGGRQALVGHLVYARLPGWEPVQRRRGRLGAGLVATATATTATVVPRQFLPAGRVDLRVVVRDVRLDAHGFRCKTSK